jgi:hypothetical protein
LFPFQTTVSFLLLLLQFASPLHLASVPSSPRPSPWQQPFKWLEVHETESKSNQQRLRRCGESSFSCVHF